MSKETVSISAKGLTMPSISGAGVNITLGEIDALRASAANAIKVAQELEAQQKLVRIEVTELYETKEPEYHAISPQALGYRRPSTRRLSDSDWDTRPERGFTESKWIKRSHVISVDTVNLEEVMGELAKEANFRLEETHKAEVTSLEQMNTTCQKKLEEVNDKYYKAEGLIRDLKDNLMSKKREADGFSDVVDKLQMKVKDYEDLQANQITLAKNYLESLAAYTKLSQQKTFWGWLLSKFNLK